MKYRTQRSDLKMTREQDKLEQFQNRVEDEVLAIIPNIAMGPFRIPRVNFLLIVEKRIL